jgi:hypothetical protein
MRAMIYLNMKKLHDWAKICLGPTRDLQTGLIVLGEDLAICPKFYVLSKILCVVSYGASNSYPMPKFQMNSSKNGSYGPGAMPNTKRYP